MRPEPTRSEVDDPVVAERVTRALAAIDGIEGWLRVDQARRLATAAARLAPGSTIVEIGSFRGRSTVALATAAPTSTVVAIDPFAGNDRGPGEIGGHHVAAAADHDAFRSGLRRTRVADRVRHLRVPSAEAHGELDGAVDLLFVDGAHRYGPAADDLDRWGRRVSAGGVMFVHDAFSSVGVTAAIGRHLLVGRRFRYLGRTGSLAEYRAERLEGPVALARDAARQLGELPWFVRNLSLKLWLTVGGGHVTRRLGREPPTWPY